MILPDLKTLRIKGALIIQKNPFNWYQVTLLPLVKKVKQLISSWMSHSKLKENKLFSSVVEL